MNLLGFSWRCCCRCNLPLNGPRVPEDMMPQLWCPAVPPTSSLLPAGVAPSNEAFQKLVGCCAEQALHTGDARLREQVRLACQCVWHDLPTAVFAGAGGLSSLFSNQQSVYTLRGTLCVRRRHVAEESSKLTCQSDGCWCTDQCSPARSCCKHGLAPTCCVPACEASECYSAIPVQVQQLLLRVHWQGDCLLADLHSLSASEARAAVLCMLASMQVRLAGVSSHVTQLDYVVHHTTCVA